MITNPMREIECDAIVVGGGPAGSTTAALLAEKGRRVAVLEKCDFPRYHVGESLMPYCWYTLDRLGVVEKMAEHEFTEKHSVQFVTTDGRVSAPFYFFQHCDHPSSTTWQVWRCKFDQMLLDNARDKGAEVRLKTIAKSLITEGDRVVGVEAEDDDGRFVLRAPVTVDASGRDMFAINRRGWQRRDPVLDKVSMWTYYEGARRDPGLDAGATTVAYLPEKGWFWYIPLKGDVVSVGIVAERDYVYRDGVKDPALIFAREIEHNAWIKEHLAPGRQVGRYHATAEFSYRGQHCASDGLVLVGDAFAFLDPVFSSGVFLALKSGELAAGAIDAALELGDVTADAFTDYSRTLCQGIEAMRKLVYAFYNQRFSFGKVIKQHPDVRGDLTDCLIGDLFRDFDELFAAVGEFAELPKPLSYGKPIVGGGVA